MLDGISLDHLRTFVVAAEAGSFSAAARRLRRVQSAVSHSISRLEARIGVELFDRSARRPTLTAAGAVLLDDARQVISGVDEMKTRARVLAAGVEPELSVVVDGTFPMEAIAQAAGAVRSRYPAITVRLAVEGAGGAYKSILDGQPQLGVVGALRPLPPGVTGEHLTTSSLVMVASNNPVGSHLSLHLGGCRSRYEPGADSRGTGVGRIAGPCDQKRSGRGPPENVVC